MFERLVLEQIKSTLIDLYGKEQHAFRPLGSTTTALVKIMDEISVSLDSKDTYAVHLTCLDVSKAFDRLQHAGLINYLLDCGVNSGFICSLRSYFQNRRANVKCDGKFGPTFMVMSGVPQGSVLGPHLIGGIPFHWGSILINLQAAKMVKYADDITIIEAIPSLKSTSCLPSICTSINELGFEINYSKSKQLCIQRSLENERCYHSAVVAV